MPCSFRFRPSDDDRFSTGDHFLLPYVIFQQTRNKITWRFVRWSFFYQQTRFAELFRSEFCRNLITSNVVLMCPVLMLTMIQLCFINSKEFQYRNNDLWTDCKERNRQILGHNHQGPVFIKVKSHDRLTSFVHCFHGYALASTLVALTPLYTQNIKHWHFCNRIGTLAKPAKEPCASAGKRAGVVLPPKLRPKSFCGHYEFLKHVYWKL